jgi:hypothetical protein
MINGKRPSGDSVLLFELKQKHLEDCTSMCLVVSLIYSTVLLSNQPVIVFVVVHVTGLRSRQV